MKKKLFSILAIALTAAVFTSCSTVSKKITFTDNWVSNIFSAPADGATESLTYAVTFEKGTSLHEDAYTIEYCVDENGKKNGSYTTTFTYAEGKFTYQTTLTLPVLYTFNGEKKAFTDVVTTTAVFENAQNSLRPISSVKEVKSTTPSNIDATNWEECYTEYDYTVKIDYAGNDSAVTWTSEKNNLSTTPQSFTIDDKEYTYLDNEQLLFAIRGFSQSKISTTQTVLSYDVSHKKVRKIEVTPSSAESSKDFKFTVNGNALPQDTAVAYVPMSISYTDDMGGAPQTLWFAQMETDANGVPVNTYRNVLLRMQVAAPYAIGTIYYDLETAVFA